MERTPQIPADVGGKLLALSLFALNQEVSIPTEEDYLKLAAELETNPPDDLTPEGLALVLQILRGEELSL